MRKVANRLAVLEERYKGLSPKARAGKINEELLAVFCVGRSEMFAWKQALKVMEKSVSISPINRTEEIIAPTHAMEIARLPEEKQEEAIKKVQDEKLTAKQTKFVVNAILNEGKKSQPIPEGTFNLIYADPPWKYDVNFLSASPDSHYLTMKTEEICNMVVPSTDNAVLFLWATNPMLEDALRVMKAWGFTYKTNIVWVKDKIGLGFYVRGQHELLLIGTKEKTQPPEESRRMSSVLVAPSNGHSVKPEAAYSLIEQMYPDAHYLELFARNKRERWTSWGNEA
jgi:N6-adenosine-specific RNA methylase IME4